MTENKTRCCEGVWCAYVLDEYRKPQVLSVHNDELEARRAAMGDANPDADVLYAEWDATIIGAWAAMQGNPESSVV